MSKTSAERMKINCLNWRKKNQLGLMFSRAKNSAMKRGLEFSITKDDIVIPEKCPLLETPFTNTYVDPTTSRDFVPSLDRIDNTKGYIPGNVWVISFKANRMKNTATLGELRLFAHNILEKHKDIVIYE